MAGRGRYRGIYMRRLVLKTYDCVVFVSSVIFFFFYIMSCVSVFSLLRAGVGGGERVGFVWVRWGARRESVEIAAV